MTRKQIIFLISVVVITIAAIIVGLILYTRYKTGNPNSENSPTSYSQTDTTNHVTSSPIVNDKSINYHGQYINAYLPNNWKLVEYSDKNGMGSQTVGGNYSGFTGFQILSPISGSIYQFSGQDGVGGVISCSTIYKFNDTDPNYIRHMEDSIKELGAMEDPPRTVTPEVIDLGNKSYSQVKLFNRSGRRIDNIIYWNELNSGNYFNPICPQNVSRMKFENVFFYNNGSKQDLYSASFFRGDYTSDELEQLDLILNSIVLK